MTYRNIWLLSISLFLFSIQAQSQRLDSLMHVLEDNFPQEKIHLHTDKSVYNPGETVWFKAYVIADNANGALSKNLYAELLDQQGNILQKKFMPILESGAASTLDIPDTVKTSRLYIRAYTSWTLNFDSTLGFLHPLALIYPKSNDKKQPVAKQFNLQFFPEGGDLVNGLKSTLAFKCNDQFGFPAAVDGRIVNGEGKTVGSFSSIHDGMGSLEFTPEKNTNYKAVWKDPKGQLQETPLPAARPEGMVLHVQLEEGKLSYTITKTESAGADYGSLYVVGQMQQKLSYSAKINLSKSNTVTAPIQTQQLPYSGILQLTIFNAQQVPVAERLIFINENNFSFITDLHAVEKNLTKRARNVLQIDVGENLLTNLSISVTDAALDPEAGKEETIFSEFLLSSDLKGKIFQPGYYFSSDEDSVKAHLDLVMMTNGWRRFRWEDLLAEKFPVIRHPRENYISLKGKVVGLSRTQIANHSITGFLKLQGDKTELLDIPITPAGDFDVNGMYFFDTAKLYYQISNDKDKILTTAASFLFTSAFSRVNPPSAVQLISAIAPLRQDTAILLKSSSVAAIIREQRDRLKSKTLAGVVVKTKQKSPAEKKDEEYSSGLFSGGDAYKFDIEGDPTARNAMSVLRYLQGKVAGLQITASGNSASATWRGSVPSFFLNESNTDVSMLETISMNDVAYIKVFRPPFFGASGGGAGGAIAVYTKKGGGDKSSITGLNFTNILGYSPIRQFYLPDYETTNDPTVADYRITLYWNPFILMDKGNRRVTIPFYNTDQCKKFRVVIEGINELGQFTREEKVFE